MLCCQELPSGEWLRFIGRIFSYPSLIWLSQWGEIPSSYWVHIWYGKTRMAGLQSGEVAWWSTQSFGLNTSTRQTYRQPRRHSKCRANAPRRAIIKGRKRSPTFSYKTQRVKGRNYELRCVVETCSSTMHSAARRRQIAQSLTKANAESR